MCTELAPAAPPHCRLPLAAMLRDTVRPLVADHLTRILALQKQMAGMPPAPAAPGR